jgi:cellulose synthase/poly-beta-1,6-N-acetylglucosamine synthase-like glycosyltransferase
MVSDIHGHPVSAKASGEPSLPLFSVCIPTFNGEPTIEESIRSVLDQTLENFELIVSDDGSTDKTLSLVKGFHDPRIRVVSGPASGTAEDNWNFVVSLARGQYVKIMGQDDLLYPAALETELMAFNSFSHHGAVITFSKRDLIAPNGNRLPRILSRGRSFKSPSHLAEILPRVVRSGRNPLGEPVCVTFEREVFQRVDGFTGTYLIDLTTWIRVLEQGPGLFIGSPQCGFRISKSSWSYVLRRSQARQTRDFIHFLRSKYPDSVSRLDTIVGSLNATLAQLVRLLVLSVVPRKKTKE